MDNRPVCIFDSGLGGLTAVAALKEILPNENIIYFGDSGRCPYGVRPRGQLRAMTMQSLTFLSQFGCKAIVAACGTMAANSLDILDSYEIPVFNVLVPSVRRAAQSAGTGPLAVIATEASIRSGLFQDQIASLCSGREIMAVPCQDFVSLCESGHIDKDDPLLISVVERCLRPIKEAGASALLLGCTHFGIIGDAIADYMGDGTEIVSASRCAVEDLVAYLRKNDLLGGAGISTFYTSGNTEEFDAMASAILKDSYSGNSFHIDPEEYTARYLQMAMEDNDYELFTQLCGHPYEISGTVVHGKGLGRTVQMPTANLDLPGGQLVPNEGVYASIVHLRSGTYIGLTSIGRRPSVDNEERITIETHILDFDEDIYNQNMTIEIRFFLRGVKKFANLKSVRDQVEKDIEASRSKLEHLLLE